MKISFPIFCAIWLVALLWSRRIIAVNCVGKDGNGINYSGDSAAVDYLGQPMTEASDREFVTTVTLDRAALRAFRDKFPAHLDADEFRLSP